MNENFKHRVVAAGLAAAALALGACALGNGPIARPEAAPAALQSAEPQAKDPESKKESTRAPVKPVPGESRTPEEASQRAADPKAPTGALIIKPPVNVMPPSDSKQ